MSEPENKYVAFISYSHRDTRWAKWLHRGLESYNIPSGLHADRSDAKPRRRLSPVFRDRDELPASGDLSTSIRDALERSRALVVVCSSNSARSKYVDAEIEVFRKLGRGDQIFPLIVDGEPPDCFPSQLTAGGAEPIAADARKEGDGKGDAKLKVISGLLGVGLDVLKRREAIRQRRRTIAAVSVLAVIALTMAILALEAKRQEKLAVIERNRAEQLSAWLEADKVESLFAEGNESEALPLLARQIRRDPGDFLAVHRLMSALSMGQYPIPVLPPMGHQSRMIQPRFISDGRYLLTGSQAVYDSQVAIWDIETGRRKRALRTRSPLHWYDITADEKRAALVTAGGELRMVDLETGKRIGPPKQSVTKWNRSFRPGDLSQDGNWVVMLMDRNHAVVVDTATGDLLLHFSSPNQLECARFSDDGSLLAIGGTNVLQVVDTATWKAWAKAPQGWPTIGQVAFSSDNSTVYAGSNKGFLQFDIASGDEVLPRRDWGARFQICDSAGIVAHQRGIGFLDALATQPPGIQSQAVVAALDYSPRRNLLLTASTDHTARLWKPQSGASWGHPMRHRLNIQGVAFHPSGQFAATTSRDRTAILWDIRPGGVRPLQQKVNTGLKKAFHDPDTERILSVEGRGWRWLDAQTLDPIGQLHPFPDPPADGIDYSAESQRLAIANRKVLEVWDLDREALLWSFTAPNSFLSIRFSPDGKLLAAAHRSKGKEKNLLLWDARSGAPRTAERAMGYDPFPMEWDSTAGRIAVPRHATGLLLRTSDGAPLSNEGLKSFRSGGLKHEGPILDFDFAPEGVNRIATASQDATARIWSKSNGEPLTAPMPHDGRVFCVDFSPDGKLVATGAESRQAQVWTADDAKPAGEPMLHSSAVMHVEFLDPDRLLTLTDEGDIQLWDPHVSQPLTPSWNNGSPVCNHQILPGSERILTAGKDGELRVWPLPRYPMPAPDWLPEIAEAIGGSRINERGIRELVPPEKLSKIREKWVKPVRNPDSESDYETWARWFFADRETRALFPGSLR